MHFQPVNTFTPGPWKWVEQETIDTDLLTLRGRNDQQVCNFGNCEQYYPCAGIEPNNEDARLIVKAPAMYDALHVLIEAFDARNAALQENPGNGRYSDAAGVAYARYLLAVIDGHDE